MIRPPWSGFLTLEKQAEEFDNAGNNANRILYLQQLKCRALGNTSQMPLTSHNDDSLSRVGDVVLHRVNIILCPIIPACQD